MDAYTEYLKAQAAAAAGQMIYQQMYESRHLSPVALERLTVCTALLREAESAAHAAWLAAITKAEATDAESKPVGARSYVGPLAQLVPSLQATSAGH